MPDLLDRLATRDLERLVATRHGVPIAVLTPPETTEEAICNIHGFMRGSVVLPEGCDLTAPVLDG